MVLLTFHLKEAIALLEWMIICLMIVVILSFLHTTSTVCMADLTCHNIGGSLVRECVAARPVSRFEGERGGMEEDRESA